MAAAAAAAAAAGIPKPTDVELAAFYQELQRRKYDDFWPEVGKQLAKTPLWPDDFDKKDKTDVAMVRRRMVSLPIRISDIPLSTYKTDGSDYDQFLVDHGLDMIDRFKSELSKDESEVTQKTDMTENMKLGLELNDGEVLKLVKSDAANWKMLGDAVGAQNFLAIQVMLGQGHSFFSQACHGRGGHCSCETPDRHLPQGCQALAAIAVTSTRIPSTASAATPTAARTGHGLAKKRL